MRVFVTVALWVVGIIAFVELIGMFGAYLWGQLSAGVIHGLLSAVGCLIWFWLREEQKRLAEDDANAESH